MNCTYLKNDSAISASSVHRRSGANDPGLGEVTIDVDENTGSTPEEGPSTWSSKSYSSSGSQTCDQIRNLSPTQSRNLDPQRFSSIVFGDANRSRISRAETATGSNGSQLQQMTATCSSFTTALTGNSGIHMDRNLAPLFPSPTTRAMDRSIVANSTIEPDPENVEAPEAWQHSNLSAINWLFDDFLQDSQHVSDPETSLNLTNQVFTGTQASNSGFTRQDQLPSILMSEERILPVEAGTETSSPASQSAVASGHYYVDGDGARLPRIRYRLRVGRSRSERLSTPGSHTQMRERHSNTFGFPEIGEEHNVDMEAFQFHQIEQDTFDDIVNCFNRTCITSSYFTSFRSNSFPSIRILGHFLNLYLEFFQPILPFLHRPTFYTSKTHWMLVLAMAAVGSHYAEIEDVDVYTIAMHEFLRRAIKIMVS